VNEILFFSLHILPAAVGLEVYSASNRNEYQKQKNMFLGCRARPEPRLDNCILLNIVSTMSLVLTS
jgi:hypothetical protein